MCDKRVMSNANSQWIERDGKDFLIKGFLNAGTVRYQVGSIEPRWTASSNCSTSFLYGREVRFFATRSEARAWVESMLAQYEAQRTTA